MPAKSNAVREKQPKPPKKKRRESRGLAGFVGVALVVLSFAGLSVVAGGTLLDRILPALTPAPTLVQQTGTPTDAPLPTPKPSSTLSAATDGSLLPVSPTAAEAAVWIPQSGSRYHLTSACSGMQNPTAVSLQEAIELGYTPCQRCKPPE